MWLAVWHGVSRVSLRTKIFGIVIAAICFTGLGVSLWSLRWTEHSSQSAAGVTGTLPLNELLLVLVTSIVVGLVVGWGLITVLTQPVRDLTRVARRVQQGDLSQRAPVWADDDIGELVRTFNAMMDSLVQSNTSLEGANAQLAARNAELVTLGDELLHKEAVRARLLASVVGAQEQERERISRELHDETGQSLTALLVQLKVFEHLEGREAVLAHAAELRALVLETLDEVRRLARDLRPATLDELGLIPTLDWHVRAFAQNTGLTLDFDAGLQEQVRLPPATELALYRVVQEALTNVARHARASHVVIRIEENEGRLCLIIRDDGCGFDVPAALNSNERGLGLHGIQERVELIGGTLHLNSTADGGTCLRVEVPLAQKAEHPW